MEHLPPLWDHQSRAISGVLEAIENDVHRILVTSPTGGGKTRIITELTEQFSNLGVVIYGFRKVPVAQTIGALDEAGVPHGVMAADYTPSHGSLVQVASAQTINSRVFKRGKWELPIAKLVVVDEPHMNKGLATQKIIERHLKDGAFLVGFTGTPVGLGEFYDTLVVGGTNSELRKCGALTSCKIWAPDEPDLNGLSPSSGGEYPVQELTNRIMACDIVGRIIPHLRKIHPTLNGTLLFAPCVSASKWICQKLNEAGIPAAHMDHETKSEERERIAAGSRSGEIKVVCNRFLLREAVNWPWLSCCIMATTFGGVSTFLQAGGRILRKFFGQDFVKLIDHGGNTWRHGTLDEDRTWNLYDTDSSIRKLKKRKAEGGAIQPIVCPNCRAERYAEKICPECGYEHTRPLRIIVQSSGTLNRSYANPVRKRKQLTPEEAVWESLFYPFAYSGKTFRQLEGCVWSKTGLHPPYGRWNCPPAGHPNWDKQINIVHTKFRR